MNIRQLRQFVAIAKSGTISRAAKELYLSQSALTRSLKNLEQELSVELVRRHANGVTLTAYGEHLLDYANCIVGDSERVRRELHAMKSGLRGQLSIGVGPSFSTNVMAPSIEKLLSKGSRLEVNVVEGFVEDLCDDLRGGSLDVVMSLFPTHFDVSDLSFVPLCDVESALVCSSSHKFAKERHVSKQQLRQGNWIIADQKYADSMFRDYLGRAQPAKGVHHIRANSVRLIKNMVMESDYLSILPKMLIDKEVKSGALCILNGPSRPLVSTGGIASRKTGFRSAALHDFVDIVKSEFLSDRCSDSYKKKTVSSLF